jgi:hypothetical protein
MGEVRATVRLPRPAAARAVLMERACRDVSLSWGLKNINKSGT